jgi:hypothetical protein
VPWLYTEISRITDAVESEWELAEQSSAGIIRCSAEQLIVQGREWSKSLLNCED